MAYELNFNLLGPPADVGGAVRAGFEAGIQRSALSALASDPTNEAALSRLAMVQPEMAMQLRDRARGETLRQGLRSAFDPQTGQIDPVAARSAYAAAGDIPGAMAFDESRAQAQTAQQQAARQQLVTVARLLDDSTDDASYQRGLAAARQMGLDVSSAPPQFDPSWVAQQRQIISALTNEQQMTTFMREATAAGIQPGTPEFAELFRNRYAPPMQAVDITNPDGSVQRQYIQRPQAGAAPGGLTTEELDALEQGGPAPAAGPATFP